MGLTYSVDLLYGESVGIALYDNIALVICSEVIEWLHERGIISTNESLREKVAYKRSDCIGYRFTFPSKQDAIWFKLVWS